MKNLSNEEIVEFMLAHFGYGTQAELADGLGCGKQNVWQFKRTASISINNAIMTMLIDEIKRSYK